MSEKLAVLVVLVGLDLVPSAEVHHQLGDEVRSIADKVSPAPIIVLVVDDSVQVHEDLPGGFGLEVMGAMYVAEGEELEGVLRLHGGEEVAFGQVLELWHVVLFAQDEELLVDLAAKAIGDFIRVKELDESLEKCTRTTKKKAKRNVRKLSLTSRTSFVSSISSCPASPSFQVIIRLRTSDRMRMRSR